MVPGETVMRRASPDKGFWLSLLINFIFRYQWGILALLLFILHFIFPVIPIWVSFIVLGIWFLHALILTLVLRLIARVPTDIHTPRPNKNPYSKSNDEYITVRAERVTDEDQTVNAKSES